MKYAVVISDGMADAPIEALNGKTPMEFANTPCMDSLSLKSEIGTVKNVPDTLPPGSDTAILSIFGCDPVKYYSGRSPLEAAGSGVILKENEVSFRVNMVALSEEESDFNEKIIYSHSGDNIEGEDSIALMKSLLEDEAFLNMTRELNMRFSLNPSFRHIGIAADIEVPENGFVPPHDILGSRIGTYVNAPDDKVSKIQRRIMEHAYEVLNVHPVNAKRRKEGKKAANSLWFWGAGRGIQLPDFEKNYGKQGAVITAVPLVEGIAALSGMKSIKVEGATGEINTNYAGKVCAALDALRNGADVAVVHIEAPDECSHMGDMESKIKAIELVDSEVVCPLAQGLAELGDFRLLVLPDHPTLLSTRTHDGTPVPYMLYDSTQNLSDGLKFSESDAKNGKFFAQGHMLIREFLSE